MPLPYILLFQANEWETSSGVGQECHTLHYLSFHEICCGCRSAMLCRSLCLSGAAVDGVSLCLHHCHEQCFRRAEPTDLCHCTQQLYSSVMEHFSFWIRDQLHRLLPRQVVDAPQVVSSTSPSQCSYRAGQPDSRSLEVLLGAALAGAALEAHAAHAQCVFHPRALAPAASASLPPYAVSVPRPALLASAPATGGIRARARRGRYHYRKGRNALSRRVIRAD
mmetsp:Transcript_6082/g.9461  ORF Transcript_6082/g.9461 Transcript_6082/m.9461 type:complete len:222 (+) Transcript_6082:160-825(+)